MRKHAHGLPAGIVLCYEVVAVIALARYQPACIGSGIAARELKKAHLAARFART
jgi:hypothetical protein